MDFAESDELQMLRAGVRRVVGQFGHAYYVEQSKTGGRGVELWEALGEQGFWGVNIPEQYGGAGLGIVELMAVSEEAAALGCPLLLALVSPAICATLLAKYGSDEQKQQYLPGLARGEKMAFAITEPNAGSNSHNLETTAKKDGTGYRLNGTKYYISGFDEAAQVLVVARTGAEDASGKGHLSLFIVDSDAAGLTSSVIDVEVCAPEKQYTLYFEDVRVDGGRLLGIEGQGLQQAFAGLQPERILAASISNGIGLYAIEKAARYAIERSVWGVPIGSHQGVAHPLAEAKVAVELSRLMTMKAACEYDAGRDAAESANMAKLAAADAGLRALDAAIQIHGGNGLATEYGLSTLWGLARLLKIAPISREMVLNYVARHSLRLPRSY